MKHRSNTGAEFEAADVARAYLNRPPYPPDLYARLLDLTPGRTSAVDLGCGPGKLALALAADFREVLAVDPSEATLARGRALDGGQHRNIQWIRSTGEALAFPTRCDLVVAGRASTGWIIRSSSRIWRPPSARPGLWRSSTATVPTRRSGPTNTEPSSRDGWPWSEGWLTTRPFGLAPPVTTHGSPRRAGSASIPSCVNRSTRLSRASTPGPLGRAGEMGSSLAARFDAELRGLLAPYAQDGQIRYGVRTELLWGQARTTAAH